MNRYEWHKGVQKIIATLDDYKLDTLICALPDDMLDHVIEDEPQRTWDSRFLELCKQERLNRDVEKVIFE